MNIISKIYDSWLLQEFRHFVWKRRGFVKYINSIDDINYLEHTLETYYLNPHHTNRYSPKIRQDCAEIIVDRITELKKKL